MAKRFRITALNSRPALLMEYVKPVYSVEEINTAAKFITRPFGNYTREAFNDKFNESLATIQHFRASHHYPMNALYVTLKQRANKIDEKAFAAQRIKRVSSIIYKLIIKRTMKLSQMQDIGGCRAVMQNLPDLYTLYNVYKTRPLTHTLTGIKDYISEPQETGYRGLHLKYRFNGKGKTAPWDRLKIEIQLRTLLQHRWATAVEVAGTFTNTALKSNTGNENWLRFFALMSSIFALREKRPTVPGTPTTYEDLCKEIRVLNSTSHIVSTLTEFHALIPRIESKSKAKYFLVTLDPVTRALKVQGFKKEELLKATKETEEAEQNLPHDSPTQVVLVSVSSTSSLKRAYPNYFLDTEDFLSDVKVITDGEDLDQ
jgi:hypothetical protein